MFREPTQAEIDYLWPYLEQKEGRTVKEFKNRTNNYIFCSNACLVMAAICLLGFQLIGVVILGAIAYFLRSYAKKKDLAVNDYVNQMTSNVYTFQIADCVLETVMPDYDNYLVGQNPSYVSIIQRPNRNNKHRSSGGVRYGELPFCKVVMSNGDTVWCPYQTTPYAEQKGKRCL